MTVWVPPTFCCFVHLVNDSHHNYYSYFIITPLGKATQVRMWPRWLTRHNRRKWINRRWKKAKAGSIVWVGSLVGVYPTKSGWWLGTWVLFSHILGIIIPTDFDIFQRGWNHQPDWIWLLGDSGQVNFSSGDHCQSYWMFFFRGALVSNVRHKLHGSRVLIHGVRIQLSWLLDIGFEYWLVVCNTFCSPIYSWDDDPIWLIFFRGVETTNQNSLAVSFSTLDMIGFWMFLDLGSLVCIVVKLVYAPVVRIAVDGFGDLSLPSGSLW